MNTQNRLTASRSRAAQSAVNLRQRRTWYSDPDEHVSTFAPWVERPQPAEPVEVDKITLNYITMPSEDAVKQAQALLKQKQYTDQHKRQTIEQVFAEARATIEERYQYECDALEDKRKALAAKPRAQTSVKPEDAAALAYTRDALQHRVKGMKYDELTAFWDAALDSGDMATARVLADFVPVWNFTRNGQPQPLPSWVQDRQARTEEATLTADQRKARAELARVENTIKQLPIVRSQALGSVQSGWAVDANGELVSAGQAQAQRRWRSSW